MITNLVITHGNADLGGGIYNSGTLTLNGSTRVNYNTASRYGGGIENVYNATLTMTGAAQAEHNTSDSSGGIDSNGDVTLMGHAHVNYNTAPGRGGGIWVFFGTVTLAGYARVDGNTAGAYGAGILAQNNASVILKGRSQVINNTSVPGYDGGITFDTGATLTACQTWTGKISPNTPDTPPTPTIDTTC
jgi:hypothetical protein